MDFADFVIFGTRNGLFAAGSGLLGRADFYSERFEFRRPSGTEIIPENGGVTVFRRPVLVGDILYDLIGTIIAIRDDSGRAGYLGAAVLFPDGTAGADDYSQACRQTQELIELIKVKAVGEDSRIRPDTDLMEYLPAISGRPYERLDPIPNESLNLYRLDLERAEFDHGSALFTLAHLKQFQRCVIGLSSAPQDPHAILFSRDFLTKADEALNAQALAREQQREEERRRVAEAQRRSVDERVAATMHQAELRIATAKSGVEQRLADLEQRVSELERRIRAGLAGPQLVLPSRSGRGMDWQNEGPDNVCADIATAQGEPRFANLFSRFTVTQANLTTGRSFYWVVLMVGVSLIMLAVLIGAYMYIVRSPDSIAASELAPSVYGESKGAPSPDAETTNITVEPVGTSEPAPEGR